MSETGKRTEDKLNLVGIVAIGLAASVFVYVSVVLLQAFYMNETATVNTTADFRGQENAHKTLRAAQVTHISEYGRNAGGPDQPQTYRIPVDVAMALVATEAKSDPSNLVPVVGKSTTPSIKAVFGRPQPLAGAPAAPGPNDATAPAADAAATPPPAVQTSRPPASTAPPGLVPPTRAEPAAVVPAGGARASGTASGAASPPTPSPAPGRQTPPAQRGAGATPPKGDAP